TSTQAVSPRADGMQAAAARADALKPLCMKGMSHLATAARSGPSSTVYASRPARYSRAEVFPGKCNFIGSAGPKLRTNDVVMTKTRPGRLPPSVWHNLPAFHPSRPDLMRNRL